MKVFKALKSDWDILDLVKVPTQTKFTAKIVMLSQNDVILVEIEDQILIRRKAQMF